MGVKRNVEGRIAIRTCETCKHYRLEESYYPGGILQYRTPRCEVWITDLITGNQGQGDCQFMRTSGHPEACGWEGRYWESTEAAAVAEGA